jgi:YesN/AraC family two-component response regulator
MVHRVVAFAFIPMESGKLIINHKNGIKIDNDVSNLEWCDHSYNYHHAVETGLCSGTPNLGHINSIGSKNSMSKLVEKDVKEIRNLRKENLTLQEIADIFNVSLATIGYIIQGKTWKHVK